MQPSPNIYSGFEYQRNYHSKILEILTCKAKKIVLVAGRRTGKSYTFAMKFIEEFLALLLEDDRAIREGRKPPWPGLRFRRAQDIREFQEGITKGTIVCPTRDQCGVIQTYIKSRLYATGAHIYLHSNEDLHRTDRGREIWFQYGKAGGVIKFRVSSQDKQLVGDKTHLLWLDECGYIENSAYEALSPLLWEHDGIFWASGTCQLGEDHWFTKLAISGLPPGHERANREIADPDPTVKTILATSLDAFLPEVRRKASLERSHYGEDSTYVKQWIDADWRLPGIFVYDNWNADQHVVSFTFSRGQPILRRKGEEDRILPRWDYTFGGKDWFEGSAPGGAVILYYWRKNPLSPGDTRPLLIAAAEHHGKDPYTSDGWWGIMKSLDDSHRPLKWFCDPHDPALIREASSQLPSPIIPASDRDKLGRIGLVKGLLHWTPTLPPAFLVSGKCENLARQFSKYQRKIKRFTGEILAEPRQYDDALLDAVAYIVGELSPNRGIGGGAIV